MTGGREYADRERMAQVLGEYTITELCHGAAKGADSLAGEYAAEHGIVCIDYPADWEGPCGEFCSPNHRVSRGNASYCPAAGKYRNQEMLDDFKPDLVIAFPGGKGTAHMTMRAAAADVPIRAVWC